MKKYVRVFFKGDPLRWFDFPLNGGDLHSFMAQARFEGFVSADLAYWRYDEIRGAMLIETTQPTIGLGSMPAVGQA